MILDRSGLAGLGLLCVLIHESGHIMAIELLKVQVDRIEFRLFGINIVLKKGTTVSYRQEILLALAGCAANLLACIPLYVLYKFGIGGKFTGTLLLFNLLLGGFNLMPVVSLDGGRALESYLCLKTNYQKAERIIMILSLIFLIPTAAAGFYIVMQTGYNISLAAAAVYIFVALVIKSGKKLSCR
ncbi:hypothetical protein V6C21_07695 [[Clostridium] cellulosi]